MRNVLEGLRSTDFYCPGSVLRISVDTSNPIARTMSKDVNAYFINSSAFEMINSPPNAPPGTWPVQVIARYAKDKRAAIGLAAGRRKDSKIALRLPKFGWANGRIIVFGFRPQHRGQTWGTFPFIWNAINLAAKQ